MEPSLLGRSTDFTQQLDPGRSELVGSGGEVIDEKLRHRSGREVGVVAIVRPEDLQPARIWHLAPPEPFTHLRERQSEDVPEELERAIELGRAHADPDQTVNLHRMPPTLLTIAPSDVRTRCHCI